MRKISLILASLPKYNPGMVAVNTAAMQFVAGISDDVTVFQAVVRSRGEQEMQPTEMIGSLPSVLDADRIIFWGDWLHMRTYIASLAAESQTGRWQTVATTCSELSRHLLLEDIASSRLNDVAIVGTTLVLDSPADRLNEGFSGPLKRLYGNAGVVYLRDIVSSSLAEDWRTTSEGCGGLDGAFFYRPDDVSSRNLESASSTTGAGYFFGRSDSQGLRDSQKFASILFKLAEVDSSWIPWFGSRVPLKLGLEGRIDMTRGLDPGGRLRRHLAVGSVTPSSQESLDRLIRDIRSREFILTDTYHLAVISWAQGVPCVLIGNSSNVRGPTLNIGGQAGIDKRFALYMTLDAVPYFVPLEDLGRSHTLRERALYLVGSVLNDVRLAESVREKIRIRKEVLHARIDAWIGGK